MDQRIRFISNDCFSVTEHGRVSDKMRQFKSRKQNRLNNYDYSSNGYYYVTICSRDRKNIFGEYKNAVGAPLACARENIKLSKIGREYIINNPKTWELDKNNIDSLEVQAGLNPTVTRRLSASATSR